MNDIVGKSFGKNAVHTVLTKNNRGSNYVCPSPLLAVGGVDSRERRELIFRQQCMSLSLGKIPVLLLATCQFFPTAAFINNSSAIMSSGIGVKGTLGRCYPFYADLRKCVVSWVVVVRKFAKVPS